VTGRASQDAGGDEVTPSVCVVGEGESALSPAVGEGAGDSSGVGVGVGVPVAVGLGEVVPCGDDVGPVVPDCVGVDVGLGLVAVPVPVGDAEGEPVGVGDSEEPGLAEGSADVVTPGEPSGAGGALIRMSTIWALKLSSCSVISTRLYDVIPWANCRSWFHTWPRASRSSSPGSCSTDSTSWLAMAAVMHW
jgi:hypothetical protein